MVRRLLLIPPVLSFLLLAAHELRTGDPLHLTGWLAAAVLLIAVRRPWVRPVCILTLCLGLVVWIGVTVELVRFRIFLDEPFTLLIVIMAGTACLILASALILFSRPMQALFGERTDRTGSSN